VTGQTTPPILSPTEPDSPRSAAYERIDGSDASTIAAAGPSFLPAASVASDTTILRGTAGDALHTTETSTLPTTAYSNETVTNGVSMLPRSSSPVLTESTNTTYNSPITPPRIVPTTKVSDEVSFKDTYIQSSKTGMGVPNGNVRYTIESLAESMGLSLPELPSISSSATSGATARIDAFAITHLAPSATLCEGFETSVWIGGSQMFANQPALPSRWTPRIMRAQTTTDEEYLRLYMLQITSSPALVHALPTLVNGRVVCTCNLTPLACHWRILSHLVKHYVRPFFGAQMQISDREEEKNLPGPIDDVATAVPGQSSKRSATTALTLLSPQSKKRHRACTQEPPFPR
jgi:hypothetical protein